MGLPVQLVNIQPLKGQSVSTASLARRNSWLARWHLLSLDAPCVAVVWTWFVARTAHVPLPQAVPAAMFLAVWIVYSADRLLDGIATTETVEARHRFHHRHRRFFAIAIAIATAVLVPLTLAIPWPVLKLYLGLACLLLVWFAIVHAAPSHSRKLPKELLPGVFCAATAFIPVWSAIGVQHRELAAEAVLYCTLITLNCWCIYAWEHDRISDAHTSTRFGVSWLRELLLALVVVSLAAAFRENPIFLATALSAALLLTLHQNRHRFDRTDLRAAADLVLLTPLLFLAMLR